VITARDVARLAHVSTSTVSHVINGTRPVSPQLRDRVLAAMQDLGYEPNAVARSLKIKRSHTLGLIISDIANPFFTAVVRGVEDVAQAKGYMLIVGNSDEDPTKEEAYLRLLAARRVDGLILAPAGEPHPYLDRLVRDAFPLVFLDREVPQLPVPAVLLDSIVAAEEAVRHLIGLGHRRIGMIAGRSRISSTSDRIAGYRHALAAAGIPYDQDLVVSGGSRAEGGAAAAEALLELRPRPTALFTANNLMTIGAIGAVQARGLRIPEDIAVVGFDDFSWADVFRPRLTTVAQPTYELGRVAAELLVRRIDEGDTPPARVVLPGRLIVRESCGARPTNGLETNGSSADRIEPGIDTGSQAATPRIDPPAPEAPIARPEAPA
jgi:LacI family transcriptional regulator